MHPFNLTELEAISENPDSQNNQWLVDAEDSIEFLRRNTEYNEIVIYASTKCALVHGALALKRRLTPDGINKVAGQLMQAAIHILGLAKEGETMPDLVQGPLR